MADLKSILIALLVTFAVCLIAHVFWLVFLKRDIYVEFMQPKKPNNYRYNLLDDEDDE